MPPNVFKALTYRNDSENPSFFQRFRRQGNNDVIQDESKRRPSIRRQVLTRGFRRNHDDHENEEVILPVLPPNADRRATVEDYDSFGDDESYVDVPMHTDPSIHHAPSIRGVMPGAMDHRDGHANHSQYEPSMHHFNVPRSADENYSDVGSPRYPMGGYAGSRDLAHRPMHMDRTTMSRTESIDSRDHDMGRALTRRPMHLDPAAMSRTDSLDSRDHDMGRGMSRGPTHMDRSAFSHTESVDSRDDDFSEEGRRHPAFSHAPSQSIHHTSRSHAAPSSKGHRAPSSRHPAPSSRGHPAPSSRGHPTASARDVDYPYPTSASRVYDPPAPSIPPSVASSIAPALPRAMSASEGSSTPMQHSRDIEPERYADPPRSHGGSSSRRHGERTPDTYYIIPAGVSVVFQDEHGNEIRRVGDFSGKRSSKPRRMAPLVVQDEHGRELYRYDGSSDGSSYGGGSDKVSYKDQYGSSLTSSNGPNVILIDHDGRQIPVAGSSLSGSSLGGSHRSGSSSGSHRR